MKNEISFFGYEMVAPLGMCFECLLNKMGMGPMEIRSDGRHVTGVLSKPVVDATFQAELGKKLKVLMFGR